MNENMPTVKIHYHKFIAFMQLKIALNEWYHLNLMNWSVLCSVCKLQRYLALATIEKFIYSSGFDTEKFLLEVLNLKEVDLFKNYILKAPEIILELRRVSFSFELQRQ